MWNAPMGTVRARTTTTAAAARWSGDKPKRRLLPAAHAAAAAGSSSGSSAYDTSQICMNVQVRVVCLPKGNDKSYF